MAQLSWIAVTQVKVEPGDSETGEGIAIIHPEKNGWGLCHPWDQFFTWGKKEYECSDVIFEQKKLY